MPMYSLTILPRGQALGYTSFVPEKELFLQTKDMFDAQLDVTLGGRVAEEIIFGRSNLSQPQHHHWLRVGLEEQHPDRLRNR